MHACMHGLGSRRSNALCRGYAWLTSGYQPAHDETRMFSSYDHNLQTFRIQPRSQGRSTQQLTSTCQSQLPCVAKTCSTTQLLAYVTCQLMQAYSWWRCRTSGCCDGYSFFHVEDVRLWATNLRTRTNTLNSCVLRQLPFCHG